MQEGDKVTVEASVVVFNHPQHRGEAFDMKGQSGEVVSVLDSFFFTCIVFHFLTFIFCCWEISTEQGDHKHRVGEADKLGRVLVVPAYFAAILGVIGANDTGPEFWCFLALAVAYLAFYLGADVTALTRSRVRAAPPEAEAPAPSVDTRK